MSKAADSADSFRQVKPVEMQKLLQLDAKSMLSAFKQQSFAFWMICCYFFFEYVRPHAIIRELDVLPWMQLFILLSAVGLFLGKRSGKSSGMSVLFWLIVFFVVILISGYFSFRPAFAWSSLDKYYLWAIIFFLITRVAYTEKHLFFLLAIFFVASLKMSVFGARVWAMRGFSFTSWGMKGPPGFFENSGELAVQMVVFFAVSFYIAKGLMPYVDRWRRWLLMATPVTAAMTVMAASSRGSQVALLVQLYFIFLHGRISIRAFLVAGVVGFVTYHALPDEQWERFSEIGEDRTSVQRMLYWENGWEMMKENPAFGVGYFNFIPYFETYYPEDMLYDNGQLAHNIFVQVGADLGFVGLAVYLILVYLGFSIPRKSIRLLRSAGMDEDWRVPTAKGLALGFLGFLIGGQFVSIVYYPFMWMHLALSCVLHSSVRNSSIEGEKLPIPLSRQNATI
ncbi:MAG: O-antigen ligase family protein [Pseudomonadota bacterium]